MRIFAGISLVLAVVFVAMPDVNSNLWNWFSNASLFSKIWAITSLVTLVSIAGYQAIGFRAGDIQPRTWRNFAFISTTIAVGLVMFGMLSFAISQSIPVWISTSLVISFATAFLGWVNFYRLEHSRRTTSQL